MNEYSASSPLPSETVEMELNTESIIEVILNQLQGRIYDHKTNSYRKVGEALVNAKGEKKIATALAVYISRDKFLSVLSKEDINSMTQEAAEAMVIVLGINYREFGIRKSDLPLVLRTIEHTIYANLKRAQDGRTLDHIGNIVKVSERESKSGNAPFLSNPWAGSRGPEEVRQ